MRALLPRAVVGLACAALLVGCSASGTVGSIVQETSSATASPAAGGASASPAASEIAPGLVRFYSQRLTWQSCGGDFECATLMVPLDYAAPTGASLGLALIRLPASGPTRTGSLVTDPGGPGASGVDFVRAARAIFSDDLRSRYDVVGFDPRGVQRSQPVQCLSDSEWDTYFALDGSPDTPAEVQQIVDWSTKIGKECKARSGAVFQHMSTVESARDMDILRAALGEKSLTYFGFSYGTLLGATYADLFPTKVGRMVLDGAVDPSLTYTQLQHDQGRAFELALGRFVEDCDRHTDCPLPPGTDAGLARLAAFFTSLDSRPLPTGDPARPLTQALGLGSVLDCMYFPAYGDWDTLRANLKAAFAGDGTPLLQTFDLYQDRNDSGHYTSNLTSAYLVVDALDYPDRPGPDQAKVLATQWAQESPLLGATFAWGTVPFHWWPTPATGHPHQIHAQGAPPILVVGTTFDPATPYQWAQSLAKQLASGVLLTRVGDGHTGYGKGSTCTDSAVDEYLVNGVMPPAGTVCH